VDCALRVNRRPMHCGSNQSTNGCGGIAAWHAHDPSDDDDNAQDDGKPEGGGGLIRVLVEDRRVCAVRDDPERVYQPYLHSDISSCVNSDGDEGRYL
jgi:hypothetical protein